MSESDRPQVVVVLGATGGIGSALVRRLHARSVRLILAARGEERLAALARETEGIAVVTDATRSADVDQLFTLALEHHGQVDGAVCCVGSLLLKPAHLTTDQEWADTLRQNLDAAFFTLRAATRAMLKTGGAITLCASAAAHLGMANHEAIAAAKAGIAGLTRAAAASYGPRGIRINAVAPGLVRTGLSAKITAAPASLQASIAMHAVGRIGEPEDIASAIDWLMDRRQTFVTGQVLGVDGGLATVRARA